MLMVTKLGRVMTYHKELPKLILIMWSCEMMSQTKNISPLPESLWPPNLTGCNLP